MLKTLNKASVSIVLIHQFSYATHPYWRGIHKGNLETRKLVKDVGFFDMIVKPTLFNTH